MANESRLRVVIEALNAAKGELGQLEKDLKGVGTAAKDSKGPLAQFTQAVKDADTPLFDAFQAVQGQLLTATGLVAGFGIALNQAFVAARQGAVSSQTTQSFDGLIERIGASNDLLDQLREKSRGTVSDLQLMSATTTLLAGAQGELATNLANATPQLLEIAKAAQKLNPSLGDTTFLYESLATGIKRGSPLILDNLGLTISVEQANKKYADTLGKTVDQLTVEEQKMALLNATLDAGNVLIQQAGGNAEAATDPFDRMGASFANAGNALKEKLSPGLANTADAIALLLTWQEKIDDAFRTHEQNIITTGNSYADYVAELQRSADVAGHVVVTQERYNELLEVSAAAGLDMSKAVIVMTEAEFNAAKATQHYGEGFKQLADHMRNAKTQTDETVLSQQQLQSQMAMLTASLSGPISGAQIQYRDEITGLRDEQAELAAEIEKYTLLQGTAIGPSENLAELQHQQALAAFELQEAQQALVQAQGDLATSQAQNLGLDQLFTGRILEAQVAIDSKRQKLDELNATVGTAMGGTADYSKRLDELKQKYGDNQTAIGLLNAELTENINRTIFGAAQAQLSQEDLAHGGAAALMVLGEQLGLVDEQTAGVFKAFADLAQQNRDDGIPAWQDFEKLAGTLSKKLIEETTPSTRDQTKAEKELTQASKDAHIELGFIFNDLIGIKGAADSAASAVRTLNGQFESTPQHLPAFGGSTATSTIGGVRADGGPIDPGKAYLVGEQGPEWFVSGRSGSIVPMSGGGGSMHLSLSIPVILDGREVGRASFDGTVEEMQARGFALQQAL